MATLNIPNLPDDVRAALHGRSMEADPSALQALVDDLYGPDKPTGVADRLIAERRREAGRM